MSTSTNEPGAFLDLTDEQRRANKAHVAAITETVRRVALTLPLQADVDDFRRTLINAAPNAKGGRS
jgi:hypothetical protein